MKAALATLGKVVAPATLVTGLMYYFGWMYAQTFSLGLGIHPDLLGLSTQDYLLRSVDALFVPLVLLCATVLVLVWLHGRLAWSSAPAAHPPGARRLLLGVGMFGLLLALLSAAAVFWPSGVQIAGLQIGYAAWAPRWAPPVGIVLGAATSDYALQARRRLREASGPAAAGRPQRRAGWETTSQRLALGGLMLLGLFWATHLYALDVGHVRVWQLRQDPGVWGELPSVVLYSPEDLLLDAPGISVSDCANRNGAYRVRYTGLRLFTYANERYFLLPSEWPVTGGPAIVLADDPRVRVDLLPGRVTPDPVGGCESRDAAR